MVRGRSLSQQLRVRQYSALAVGCRYSLCERTCSFEGERGRETRQTEIAFNPRTPGYRCCEGRPFFSGDLIQGNSFSLWGLICSFPPFYVGSGSFYCNIRRKRAMQWHPCFLYISWAQSSNGKRNLDLLLHQGNECNNRQHSVRQPCVLYKWRMLSTEWHWESRERDDRAALESSECGRRAYSSRGFAPNTSG